MGTPTCCSLRRGSAAFLGKSLLPPEKRKELALYELSGFTASQGSQNIQSQICGCWASPKQPWSPSGQVASVCVTMSLSLSAKPQRAGRPGVTHLLAAWLCLAGLSGHRAHNSFLVCSVSLEQRHATRAPISAPHQKIKFSSFQTTEQK